MIVGTRHIGIVVTDIDNALGFYRDLLGLNIIKDSIEASDHIDRITGLSGVRLRIVKLSAEDGSIVELLQFLSHSRKDIRTPQIFDIGCSHVAFTVNNIDMEYTRLFENGVKFNCPPCISPDGYAKYAYCHDPDGIIIELVEVL